MMNGTAIAVSPNNRHVLYWSIVIALAVLALGVAFWPRRAAELNKRNPNRKLEVDVKWAVSGNKIRLDDDDDEYVIYAGIRAPFPQEPMYDASKERNDQLVSRKEVRLRFGDQRRDKKGRLLAYVFADDEFVNETLVREGLAYVRLTPTTKRKRLAERLLSAQKEARKRRRGLWKTRKWTREPAYPADPKYGSFHRPSCERVPKINPKRLIHFKSARQAFDAGFAPCSKCSP